MIADLLARREFTVPQPYLEHSFHLEMHLPAPVVVSRFHTGDFADRIGDIAVSIRPFRINFGCAIFRCTPPDVHRSKQFDVFRLHYKRIRLRVFVRWVKFVVVVACNQESPSWVSIMSSSVTSGRSKSPFSGGLSRHWAMCCELS